MKLLLRRPCGRGARVAAVVVLVSFCGAVLQAAEDFNVKASRVVVTDLRCEYMIDPWGVDRFRPRLFWKLESEESGQRQTAYEVLVASTREKLAGDEGNRWSSGRVATDQSAFVPYGGVPLQSRDRCWWKVRVLDKDGALTPWSEPAFWSTGILEESDWRGNWIASDLELMEYQETLCAMTDHGMEPETEIWALADKCREMTKNVTEAPAVYLRKEFRTPGAIRHATAYISGLGLYELSINGHRIGDRYLDPAYTDYDKRVLYAVYDVRDVVTSGTNAVGVTLGNGWFNLITPHSLRYYAADYIAPPRLRFELEIEYADGSRETIASGPDWKFTTDGPIRFNCVLAGETYDARKEMPGWDQAGFDDSGWIAALPAEAPKGALSGQIFPPVRKLADLEATSVTRHGDGWRFDLGEENAGWARLKLRGRAGQEITIHYPGSGSHTLGRYQTCKYICRGGSQPEVFAPRFCYNGHRFVDVVGLDYEPELSDLTGEVIGTELDRRGSFSCSDERLNRLQEILLRTIRNYVMHIPCDPTREKAGWTQDVESNFFPFAYNYQVAPTFIKWQRDFLDGVQASGYVPPVVPGRFDGPTINGPWWGGAVVYGPWFLYQFYGDDGILEESYPGMQRYLGYLDSIAEEGVVQWGLGDWMEVGSVRPIRTPVPFTSTAAYCWFSDILAQSARVLGKEADAVQYETKAARLRERFNQVYFNQETGVYTSGSQTAQLLPLALNLAPPDKRELVAQRLEERIAADGGHLSTGFVGTPFLLTGLAEIGRPDLAWTIATQEDYPSFIDALLNRGQTVMKEDWKGGLVQMPTLQGPIGAWFFHTLAGIRPDPVAPGFKKFVLKPEPPDGLRWVKSHYETHYGEIVSEWEREESRFSWIVTVPPNTTATVFVPTVSGGTVRVNGKPLDALSTLTSIRRENGAVVFQAEPGHYHFESGH